MSVYNKDICCSRNRYYDDGGKIFICHFFQYKFTLYNAHLVLAGLSDWKKTKLIMSYDFPSDQCINGFCALPYRVVFQFTLLDSEQKVWINIASCSPPCLELLQTHNFFVASAHMWTFSGLTITPVAHTSLLPLLFCLTVNGQIKE